MKEQFFKISLIALLFTLAGCNTVNNNTSGTNTHTHTFDTEWKFDDTYHWHESTCEHDVKDCYEEHSFVDGICSACGYRLELNYYVSKINSVCSDGSSYYLTCDYDIENRTVTYNIDVKDYYEYSGCEKYIYNEKNLCVYYYSSNGYGGLCEYYFEYDDHDFLVKNTCFYNEEINYIRTYEYDELKRLKKMVATTPPDPQTGYDGDEYSIDYNYFDGYYLELFTSSLGTSTTKYVETIDEINGTKTVGEYFLVGSSYEFRNEFTYDIKSGLIIGSSGNIADGYTTLNENSDPLHIEYYAYGVYSFDFEANFSYLDDGTLKDVCYRDRSTNYIIYPTHDENGNVCKEEIYELDDQQNEILYMTTTYEIEALSSLVYFPPDLTVPATKGAYNNNLNNNYFNMSFLDDDELI